MTRSDQERCSHTNISRRAGCVPATARPGMTSAFFTHPRRRSWATAGKRREEQIPADQVQRLDQRRSRQYHQRRMPGRRNGAGRLYVVAIDTRGRTRRRLAEKVKQVRAGQSKSLRQCAHSCSGARSGPRASRCPLFRPLRMAGRAGAQGSARCGRREMESAGRRTDDRQEHDHAQEVGPEDH